jgi:hypothetical protein
MVPRRVPGPARGPDEVSGSYTCVPGPVGHGEPQDPDCWVGTPPDSEDGSSQVEKVVQRDPEPTKRRQPSPSTCWAGALLSWLYSTGAINVAAAERHPPDPRHQNPRGLVDYYKGKSWKDGRPYLEPNESMREESAAQEIWRSVCSDEGGAGGGLVNTERFDGNSLSYDVFARKLNISYALVAEKRTETWKHVYVVYKVVQEKGNWVVIYYMDPDGGKLNGTPLESVRGSTFWITTRTPCAGSC